MRHKDWGMPCLIPSQRRGCLVSNTSAWIDPRNDGYFDGGCRGASAKTRATGTHTCGLPVACWVRRQKHWRIEEVGDFNPFFRDLSRDALRRKAIATARAVA